MLLQRYGNDHCLGIFHVNLGQFPSPEIILEENLSG